MNSQSLARLLPTDAAERYRLTPNPNDNDEQRLVQADLVGRKRAADEVAEYLGGFRIEPLAQAISGSPAAVIEVDRAFHGSLDTEAVVDRLLALEVTSMRIRLADGSRTDQISGRDDIVRDPPGDGPARVRLGALANGLQRGLTAIVNDAGPSLPWNLIHMCQQAGRAWGTQPQVNVYISEREAPGFGRHWDDHDVIVIQGVGKKRWEIFAPTSLSPTRDRVTQDMCGERVLSTILEPGMALFIPRGWPHRVSGFPNILSAHFTLGIARLSFADMVRRRSLSSSLDDDGWQVVDLDDPERTIGPWKPVEVEHEVGSWRRQLDAIPAGGLPAWIDAAAHEFSRSALQAPVPGGTIFVDRPDCEEHEVGLAQTSRSFAIDRRAVPAVAKLMEGSPVAFDELADLSDGDPSLVSELIRFLAVHDLVGIVG